MMNTLDLAPDREALRRFGLTMGIIIPLLFGIVLPWIVNFKYPIWPWGVSLVFVLWALISPRTLKIVYILWMRFGLLMNRITTPLVMGIVFFLVITPVALMMKVAGRDPMERKFDKNTNSYFIKSKHRTAEHMEKPF